MKNITIFLAIILLLAFVVYSNSLGGEFQFDDQVLLMKMSGAKGLRESVGRMVGGAGFRPVTDLTFALNYHFGGFDVRWYHLTNIFIHLLNGLLVFHLVRLTMRSERLSLAFRNRADTAALVAAALFLLHPVQTQAVSYVSQRYESLASLFYLVSMVAYIRAVKADAGGGRAAWYLASALSYVLGLGSKEIAVTIPVAILLYDFYFLRSRPVLGRLAFPASLMLASVAAGAAILIRLGGSDSAGFGVQGITPVNYLFTQFKAIVIYLRLLVLPVNQNLDYDMPLSLSLLEPATALSLAVLLALLVLAALTARRWRLCSFCILWFFLILAPTSSIVPVIDPIYEHRMYLASAGMFMIFADLASRLLQSPRNGLRKAGYTLVMIVVLVLSGATYERNKVWASGISLWEDVARKSPAKPRVHYNLGNAYKDKGRMEEAIEQYELSVSLDPRKSNAYNNLANAYIYFGRYGDAVDVYKKAIRYDPKNYEAYYNLGTILARMGDKEESARYLSAFIRRAPEKYRKQKDMAREKLERAGKAQ